MEKIFEAIKGFIPILHEYPKWVQIFFLLVLLQVFVLTFVMISYYVVRPPQKQKETRPNEANQESTPQETKEYEVTGEIRDGDGKKGLPGVKVSIAESSETTQSDSSGRFKLRVRGTTDGRIRLKASKDGYNSQEDYFKINGLIIIHLYRDKEQK